MNRSVCFTELIKDENGFYKAGQTMETAYIRTYLKENGIDSMIYVDESLPSINDMCDDILSLSDEVIVFVVNKECKEIMQILVSSIMELEDIETYIIGEILDIEDAVNLGLNPEQELAEILGETNNEELSILSVSPYRSGILQARDINQYGIWIGNNTYGMRSIDAIRADIQELIKVYSGLSETKEKTVHFKGDFINNEEFLASIVEEISNSDINFLKFNLPVYGDIIIENNIISKSNSKFIYSLKFEEALKEDKVDKLINLIKCKKINEVYISASLFNQESKFISIILSAAKAHLIHIIPVGEIEVENLSEEAVSVLLENTRRAYLPFYRGFINSRVGSYPVNKLDGYVRHLEISQDLLSEDNEFLNEVMKVNSSIYIKDKNFKIEDDKWTFNENGVVNINNKELKSIDSSIRNNNVNVSNIITMDDNSLHNNSLAYVSSSDIYEIPYKEGKKLLRINPFILDKIYLILSFS